MKRIAAILIAMILSLNLSACNGFNHAMYDHLTDAANYHDYQVTVRELIRSDDGGALIKVIFDNYEDVRAFLGGTPNQDIALSAYVFSLEITAENAQILTSNGFLDDIAPGDMVEVKVSNFIYSDSDFFYVAALCCDGKTYLDFEDGLQNIIKMMKQNTSFF